MCGIDLVGVAQQTEKQTHLTHLWFNSRMYIRYVLKKDDFIHYLKNKKFTKVLSFNLIESKKLLSFKYIS
jgi:hypothetical protein